LRIRGPFPPALNRDRLLVHGYRYGEVPLPELPPIKVDALITKARYVPLTVRPAVLVDLGCSVVGSAPPHPDPQDPETMRAGVCKRFCSATPVPDEDFIELFRKFVHRRVREKYQRPSPATDVSFETWIESTNYPRKRKDELIRLYNEREGMLSEKDFLVKSFQKDETYVEFKHARAINSRTDMFKCFVGPIFRIIEKIVFEDPAFIKKIPVRDRPNYIRQMLERVGAKYGVADYTSFETLFTEELMKICEMELYSYLSSSLVGGAEWFKIVLAVLTGDNECIFKAFKVFCHATRMSGEMCTSLGNGFTNLMVIEFLAEINGCTDLGVVVEGDDSEFTMCGPFPTADQFKKLGLNVKMQIHTRLEEASFCGLMFDFDDLVNVTDPREVLNEFGWALRSYAHCRKSRLMTLLRCKALSYAHQYPGTPIIQELAEYALRMTRSYDVSDFIENNRSYSEYEREQVREAFRFFEDKGPYYCRAHIDVPINTRHLVERLFEIDVSTQLEIESYLRSLKVMTRLSHPAIVGLMQPQWVKYFSMYHSKPLTFSEIDCPDFPGYQYEGFVHSQVLLEAHLEADLRTTNPNRDGVLPPTGV